MKKQGKIKAILSLVIGVLLVADIVLYITAFYVYRFTLIEFLRFRPTLFFWWPFLGVLIGIAGISLGVSAKKQIKADRTASVTAISGIALSICYIVFFVYYSYTNIN